MALPEMEERLTALDTDHLSLLLIIFACSLH